MKKFILFVFVVNFGFAGFSQNNSIGSNDPAAKKILDEVTAKMKTYKAIQATFTLKVEDAKGNPQGTKKGVLSTKGNKYRLNITGQEIYCDGKNQWTYDKSANEVTVTKYDPSSTTATSPERLLSNFYDKDFLYKLNGEQKMGTKTVSEIEMTPIDKTKNIFKIYLYIDKATKTLYSGKALDKSGNRYLYTINSLNGKVSMSDSDFVFDKAKHPGVEVVDLGE